MMMKRILVLFVAVILQIHSSSSSSSSSVQSSSLSSWLSQLSSSQRRQQAKQHVKKHRLQRQLNVGRFGGARSIDSKKSADNKQLLIGFAYAPNFITKTIEEQIRSKKTKTIPIHQQPQQQQQPQQAFGLSTIASEQKQSIHGKQNDDSNNDDDELQTTTTTLLLNNIDTIGTNYDCTSLTSSTLSSFHIKTRFPPEPNGYLHLGHAKSICFNNAVAKLFNGTFNMRMDDTNPSKEDKEYVNAILEDVIWVLSDSSSTSSSSGSSISSSSSSIAKQQQPPPWDGPVRKTSDYFDLIYDCAMELIKSGDAYVDSISAEQMKELRGTLTEPGMDSPYRTRTISENIQLFTDMKNGIYRDGEHVVRAKIAMNSTNMNMRDPTLYRIKHETHQETGTKWCIYPMYDFSHPISDSYENITHSLCTLEFEDHRPFYEWTLDKLISDNPNGVRIPQLTTISQQIEFSRLNIHSTVLSKRKLIQLVTEQYVNGWDDPRMPTICGLRRRGVPPEAIRLFCERIGISKSDSNIDYVIFEDCIRETMDTICPRAFGVFEPLKVTITNLVSDNNGDNDNDVDNNNSNEVFIVDKHPKDKSMGQRSVPFSNTIYIERSDFFDTIGPEGEATNGIPPKGYKRLVPNGFVRLRYAYVIQCNTIIRDENTNEPIELQCTYYPETRAGVTPESMSRVNGIIHWVDSKTCTTCTVHQYDRLFVVPEPGKDSNIFLDDINPNSLDIQTGVLIEQSIALEAQHVLDAINNNKASTTTSTSTGTGTNSLGLYPSLLSYQFERNGYYALDKASTDKENLIFNRVVTLRDTWGHATGSTVAATTTDSITRVSDSTTQKQQQQPTMTSNELIDDIRRVSFQVVTIVSAEQHPDADTLLICKVDCGTIEPRTVVSGVAGKIPIESLIGQKVVAVTNLKPSKMRGIESTAMLLAASSSLVSSSSPSLTSSSSSHLSSRSTDDGTNCTTLTKDTTTMSATDTDTEMEIVELLQVPDTVPNGEILQFEGMEQSQPDPMMKSKGAIKAFERAMEGLQSNNNGYVVYSKKNRDDDSSTSSETKTFTMISSGGPITTKSLRNARIQ